MEKPSSFPVMYKVGNVGIFVLLTTARNRSVCQEFCPQGGGVHGGGHAWQRRACMAGGMCSRGACMARGHAYLGAYMAGGHVWQGGLHGRGFAW